MPALVNMCKELVDSDMILGNIPRMGLSANCSPAIMKRIIKYPQLFLGKHFDHAVMHSQNGHFHTLSYMVANFLGNISGSDQ